MTTRSAQQISADLDTVQNFDGKDTAGLNAALDRLRADRQQREAREKQQQAAPETTTPETPTPTTPDGDGRDWSQSSDYEGGRPNPWDGSGRLRNPGADPLTGLQIHTGSSQPRTPEEIDYIIRTVGEAYASAEGLSAQERSRANRYLFSLRGEMQTAINNEPNRDKRRELQLRWQPDAAGQELWQQQGLTPPGSRVRDFDDSGKGAEFYRQSDPWSRLQPAVNDPNYGANQELFNQQQAELQEMYAAAEEGGVSADEWARINAKQAENAAIWRGRGNPALIGGDNRVFNPASYWQEQYDTGFTGWQQMRAAEKAAAEQLPSNPADDWQLATDIADRARFGTFEVDGQTYIGGRVLDDGSIVRFEPDGEGGIRHTIDPSAHRLSLYAPGEMYGPPSVEDANAAVDKIIAQWQADQVAHREADIADANWDPGIGQELGIEETRRNQYNQWVNRAMDVSDANWDPGIGLELGLEETRANQPIAEFNAALANAYSSGHVLTTLNALENLRPQYAGTPFEQFLNQRIAEVSNVYLVEQPAAQRQAEEFNAALANAYSSGHALTTLNALESLRPQYEGTPFEQFLDQRIAEVSNVYLVEGPKLKTSLKNAQEQGEVLANTDSMGVMAALEAAEDRAREVAYADGDFNPAVYQAILSSSLAPEVAVALQIIGERNAALAADFAAEEDRANAAAYADGDFNPAVYQAILRQGLIDLAKTGQHTGAQGEMLRQVIIQLNPNPPDYTMEGSGISGAQVQAQAAEAVAQAKAASEKLSAVAMYEHWNRHTPDQGGAYEQAAFTAEYTGTNLSNGYWSRLDEGDSGIEIGPYRLRSDTPPEVIAAAKAFIAAAAEANRLAPDAVRKGTLQDLFGWDNALVEWLDRPRYAWDWVPVVGGAETGTFSDLALPGFSYFAHQRVAGRDGYISPEEEIALNKSLRQEGIWLAAMPLQFVGVGALARGGLTGVKVLGTALGRYGGEPPPARPPPARPPGLPAMSAATGT